MTHKPKIFTIGPLTKRVDRWFGFLRLGFLLLVSYEHQPQTALCRLPTRLLLSLHPRGVHTGTLPHHTLSETQPYAVVGRQCGVRRPCVLTLCVTSHTALTVCEPGV